MGIADLRFISEYKDYNQLFNMGQYKVQLRCKTSSIVTIGAKRAHYLHFCKLLLLARVMFTWVADDNYILCFVADGPKHYYFSMNRLDGSQVPAWPLTVNARVEGSAQAQVSYCLHLELLPLYMQNIYMKYAGFLVIYSTRLTFYSFFRVSHCSSIHIHGII